MSSRYYSPTTVAYMQKKCYRCVRGLCAVSVSFSSFSSTYANGDVNVISVASTFISRSDADYVNVLGPEERAELERDLNGRFS